MSMDDTAPPKPRRRLLNFLAMLLGIASFLLALLWIGQWTRERIANLERYTVAFAEVDCPPPPDQSLPEFLAEVQYLGGLPDRLHVLDDKLPSRLADAFARHPEVDKVLEVRIATPRQVHVRLSYRTPVLAVVSSASQTAAVFVVDSQGVLLHSSHAAGDLPTFGTRSRPAGPAGHPWGDAAVVAAARTAALLQPYRDQLPMTKIDISADELILTGSFAGRILWGHAPGAENPDEAVAAQKIERLLEYVKTYHALGDPTQPREHDVRPNDRSVHGPIRTQAPAR